MNYNSEYKDEELEIPAEIGGCPVTEITEAAYAGNEYIEYVSIPNSVFIIGKDAFRGCTNLKEVCVSDSVSTICEGGIRRLHFSCDCVHCFG